MIARRWRMITVLACAILATVVVLVLWPRTSALSIDWRQSATAETDRFECTLERVCHKTWSEIEFDEIPDGEFYFHSKHPGLDSYFLFMQFRMKADGYDMDEMPGDLLESYGPFKVRYQRREYVSPRGTMFFSTADRKSMCILVPVVTAESDRSENWFHRLLGLESDREPFITNESSGELQISAGMTFQDGNQREVSFKLRLR